MFDASVVSKNWTFTKSGYCNTGSVVMVVLGFEKLPVVQLPNEKVHPSE